MHAMFLHAQLKAAGSAHVRAKAMAFWRLMALIKQRPASGWVSITR
jgi:hypothetical protein